MKYNEQKMVGAARQSVHNRIRAAWGYALIASLALSGSATAQSLYKYRGENGEWIYSDRPPADGQEVEVRVLEPAAENGEIKVSYRQVGDGIGLFARNRYHAPIELKLLIKEIRGLDFPEIDDDLRWVLPARSEKSLFRLARLEDGPEPYLSYRFQYLAGDPAARHEPNGLYRVPYALANDFPISQAYPDVVTHSTPDSKYAVDIAMPIGTDIFAARGGVVFDVAANNYRNGLDLERDGPRANVVRILHDDGTYAIYAHLNWNSIRVRPGDRVERGQYIADSGNTGYSSGPHLHFAIVQNVGLRLESIPFEFQGMSSMRVTPATGLALTAY